MIIESVLSGIASAIIKKALVGGCFQSLVPAIQVYSTFDSIIDITDCILSENHCHDLSLAGVKVISENLSEQVVSDLLNIGNTTFEIKQTSSGKNKGTRRIEE